VLFTLFRSHLYDWNERFITPETTVTTTCDAATRVLLKTDRDNGVELVSFIVRIHAKRLIQRRAAVVLSEHVSGTVTGSARAS